MKKPQFIKRIKKIDKKKLPDMEETSSGNLKTFFK